MLRCYEKRRPALAVLPDANEVYWPSIQESGTFADVTTQLCAHVSHLRYKSAENEPKRCTRRTPVLTATERGGKLLPVLPILPPVELHPPQGGACLLRNE